MNKFKVGDKVRGFCPNGFKYEGIVGSISEEFIFINTPNDTLKFHYKCCSKLVKRIRHQFWLEMGEADLVLQIHRSPGFVRNPNTLKVIKVVEIFEKKN